MPCAGGFGPLQFLPKDRKIILGIITSKAPKLADEDEMRNKVFQAADIIAKGNDKMQKESLQRTRISPQCGFAGPFGR